MLTIPIGKSTALGNLTLTYTPGNTAITAQASGYTTGQTTVNTYLIDSYTLSVSAGLNGGITPNGTITAMLGTSQLFKITANTGYHISDITLNNLSQGPLSSYTLNNISQPHTIVANFEKNTYSINVTQTPNGQITSGTRTVNYGDTPIFTISPDEGYYIANLTVNGKSIPVKSSSGQIYQFEPVTADGSLTASFVIKKFTIQVVQTVNGTITPGTVTLSYNESQLFTITPKNGFHIVDFLVNRISIGPVSSYFAQNIQSATTISAVFAIDPTPTPTPDPSTSPTPTATLKPTTINATTENGAKIKLLITGNVTSQQITNLQITKSQSSETITVSFNVEGTNGDDGIGNFTIPKIAVDSGTAPKVYIDNAQAKSQGYSQDENNYYVWFTTHFSSHEVSIVFASVSRAGLLSQNTIYFVMAIAAVLVAVSAFVIYKKRENLKEKFENIRIFR